LFESWAIPRRAAIESIFLGLAELVSSSRAGDVLDQADARPSLEIERHVDVASIVDPSLWR